MRQNESTREAYGAALVELAGQYDFFVMVPVLPRQTQTVHFSKQYPERFIDMGIAEANLIGFAAGMSTFGTPVFASTFAAFAAAAPMIRCAIRLPIPTATSRSVRPTPAY